MLPGKSYKRFSFFIPARLQKYLFSSFFLLSLFFLLSSSSRATHLMGGNISYEYLGETFPGSNQFTYKITLITFLDCTSPYWGNGFPETSLEIGIYEGSATPSSPMSFVTTLNLPLVDSVPVAPPLPTGCAIADIPCIYQITYIQNVTLPLSFSGYHLYYERCCRNGSVVNLDNPGGQGMVFSAYIPPTIAVNSSPVFTDMPVPFICVNDTTGILNTATDPDGDLLIFSFEDPYEGEYTDAGNPAIGTFPDPVNVPFIPVTWEVGGYDKNKPFGPSGYAFINSFTGYSQYKPVAIGNYVIAVEIKEYRNGNLIGITRRDMQLLVINCPANSTPVLSTTGGSGTTAYTIQEGQSLCFPITFTDPNAITLTSTGSIFNSANTNPPATITSPVTGTGSVSTQFCWNTGCNQGQALPYLFNAEATDNGCPPKTTPIVYSITVNNFTGPSSITGINNVCPGISGLSYSTATVSGATYNWTVTGGTIISGQGTNSITVNWGNGPSGNVAVTTTSQYGCSSGPINLPVTFNAPVTVLAGNDKSICIGDTVTIGSSPTAPSGTVLVWSPSSGLSNPGIQNPVASPSVTTTYIATATNSSGCSDQDTVVVTVNALPVANAGPDTTICLSGSVQLNASGGSTYQWFPSTGLSNPNIQNPVASPTDTTTYSVVATNADNCKDTDEVSVFIITDTPADAGNDKTICAGDSVLIGGSLPVPLGATINWTPNISLSDDNILNPNAAPGTTITYTLNITTPGGCAGTDSVTVIVNPLPLANAGNDTLICDGDTVQLFASGGGTYQWSPAGGLNNTAISDPLANPLISTQYVVTVTANNCSRNDTLILSVFSSTVNVTADTSICPGDTVQLLATGSGNVVFVWSPAATLSDDSIANPLAFPNDTIEYFVNATDTNNCSSVDSVTVIVNPLPAADAGTDKEICIGDSVQLSATGGNTFAWTPDGTLSDDSISNPLAFPTDTTTYYVSVTDSKNCANTDSVKIIVNPLPAVLASNDTSICKNGTAQLNASGGISYSWTPAATLDNPGIQNPLANPADTTTYFVMATDSNNCSGTDSVTVAIFPKVISAIPDTAICLNDTVQLFVNGGSVFSWMPGTSLSDDSIASPLAFPSDTTTYTINVIDTNSCNDSASITVIVYPLPVISVTNDTAVCYGNCVSLFASGADTFLWSPTTGLDNPDIANPVSCTNDTITYFVNGSVNQSGSVCSDADSVKIIVNPLPVAQASNDTTICEGAIVQLNAAGGINYLWSPAVFLNNQTISNPESAPDDTISYSVVVSDNNSCSDTDSVTINVNKLPPADAGEDAWLCPGDSVQLAATGGNFFNWSPGTALSDPGLASPMAGPSDTIKYFVTVTDLNSCSKTDSVMVFVNGIVPTDAGSDVFICMNDSVMIGGSPTSSSGTIFTWAPAGSLNDATVSNPLAFPGDTTMYYVLTTNDTCTGTDSVLVVVNPLPAADAGAGKEICTGDTVQLNASGGISFVWTNAATLSDDSIADPLAFPGDTTKYFVTVTDANSCSNTDSVQIDVNELPVIDAGADEVICPGDSVQINAAGPALAVFAWTPAATLSDDSISAPYAKPDTVTIYFVNVTDTNGCKGLDSIMVSIFPDVVNISADTGICSGDTVQLFVTGGAIFSWTPAATLNDDSIAGPLAFPADTTTYYVNVVDTNTCNNTDSVTVIIYPLPILTVTNDTAACTGECISLSAAGADTFSWNPPAGLDNPDIANPVSCIDDTIMYYVTGTSQSAGQCSSTDSVQIIINPQPVAQAGNDTAICKGAAAQLNASGGISYQWYPPGTLSNPGISNPQSNAADTTEYFVIVSDINNCSDTDSVTVNVNQLPIADAGADKAICIGDTVQLSASGGELYAWNNPFTLSDDSIADPFAFPPDTTEYIVNITDTNNCSSSDTVMVIVNPLPDAEAGANDEICIGDSVQLNASGGVIYVWNFSTTLSDDSIANPFAFPSDTMVYFVNVADINGCSKMDSVQIDVNELPVVTAGNDTNSCKNSGVVLGGSPTAPAGSVFLWTPPEDLNDNSLANPTATPDTTTTYFVAVTDSNGCKNLDSAVVSIFTITSISDTSFCKGDSLSLFVIPVSGTDPIIYLWSPASGLGSTDSSPVQASPDSDIVYTVSVTDGKGCVETKNIAVIANNPPVADFDFILYPSCEGVLAEFENKSEGASSFLWSFGDGDTSDKENPTYVFSYEQPMSVSLEASGELCKDEKSYSGNIKSFTDYFNLKMPNVLTPNNDGLNDCFEISADYKLSECMELHVFNRWGELMYISYGNQHTWCGRTFAGEEVPEGTYFYVFDINGILFKGAVMVTR